MPRTAKPPITYCFIDAANLFYGGEKSLGWSIDYQKLLEYLKTKYQVQKCFYYAGVDTYNFPYDPLSSRSLPLEPLLTYLTHPHQSQTAPTTAAIQRVKFYLKLKQFGYLLCLKPTKIFRQGRHLTKKANCDVDLTFDLMRLFPKYQQVIILSGDGDFLMVLKYLKKQGKSIKILSRGERTAKEIKRLAGKNFLDFHYLKNLIFYQKK